MGINHPIVQEGMGPFGTARLAAAVSQAGGLGTVSMPGIPENLAEGAEVLKRDIRLCASLTDRPFAVNIPVGVDSGGQSLPDAEVYIEAILEAQQESPEIRERLRAITTSAGFPGRFVDRIHEAGLVHQHKVGSTRQARKSVDAGVDVIIAAGFEMGGHAPASGMHTMVVGPNITEAVDVPVLLTGGFRDGRGLAAAWCLGASGVAMGTRFIASNDLDWHPAYRQAVLDAEESSDVAFDGVHGPCRALRNSATDKFSLAGSLHRAGSGNDLARVREKIRLMQRAQIEGDVNNGLVLSGQVASGIRESIDVASFIPQMMAEAQSIVHSLAN
ncbi:NAD(P)H-dependent flavin oxidoreductase [Arthrobacter globiformis]|uniref:NAD(P)H-dependent flavin oxidoreductase n=1 Tax=Arthrobacter globiformis TaxID=1665 RepID=UPI0027D92F5B|nr:nitronate monooxygenase [Arthrobacter globiformis]